MPTSHKAPSDTDPADAKAAMRREAAAMRKQLAAESPDADTALARHADTIIRLADDAATTQPADISPMDPERCVAGRALWHTTAAA